jgi:cytochrome c peroxidase
LLNVGLVARLGWDGKFPDLESVAFSPITTETNMNLSETALIDRLSLIPGYRQKFADTFEDGKITRRNIELALATYERLIVSGDAPFDRWVRGDAKAQCAACHSGWAFTDQSFHDIGSAEGDDIGRGRYFPTSVKLRYAFKTPTLRDVVHRGPYMHDGSKPTLEAVIELYNKGGIARPSGSPLIKPLHLTPDEKSDLIAFLNTLSSPLQTVNVPDLPR